MSRPRKTQTLISTFFFTSMHCICVFVSSLNSQYCTISVFLLRKKMHYNTRLSVRYGVANICIWWIFFVKYVFGCFFLVFFFLWIFLVKFIFWNFFREKFFFRKNIIGETFYFIKKILQEFFFWEIFFRGHILRWNFFWWNFFTGIFFLFFSNSTNCKVFALKPLWNHFQSELN